MSASSIDFSSSNACTASATLLGVRVNSFEASPNRLVLGSNRNFDTLDMEADEEEQRKRDKDKWPMHAPNEMQNNVGESKRVEMKFM